MGSFGLGSTATGAVHDADALEAVSFDNFKLAMRDRRAQHTPMLRDKNDKPQPYKAPKRSWFDEKSWALTRGITLHQTACDMGERLERYDTIGAHFSVLRSGNVIRHCDENHIIYHGHGWNNQCVGIEINGLYPGLEDDPDTAPNEALQTTWDDKSTPWREQPMTVTPQAMRATRMLIRWICLNVGFHRGAIQALCTHRQASSQRRSDPGQAICEQVLVPLWKELGLSAGGPGFKIGDGYPNPTAWTKERVDGKEIPY